MSAKDLAYGIVENDEKKVLLALGNLFNPIPEPIYHMMVFVYRKLAGEGS